MVAFARTTMPIGSSSRDPIPAFSLYLMLYGSPLNWMDWNGEKPHVNDLGQITPTKESDCLDNFNKGSQLCMMLPTHADRTKCFKDNETQYQDCVKKFHPNRPNKKHLTETNLCLCSKSKAERESPIPGATVLPIGSYPGGPSGGGHTEYPFPATPPAPIGGGGADPCIVVVVKCGDSVTVFHFSPSNNPGGTISQYSWGSGCSAIICGGNDEFQSNCLAKEAIQAVGNAGITLVGVSSSSACGVTATGGWYVGG